MVRKTVTAEIKKLGINGEGIAYLDKKITFVQGALPREVVEIEIVRDEPTYKIGELVKVVSRSKDRVRPKCYQQGKCLGCPLMIMDYQAQLTSKHQLVKDTLNKYIGKENVRVPIEPVKASSQRLAVRNIVRLPIIKFDDRVVFGIYQRESKYLSLMSRCPMQSKRINSCLTELESLFSELHLHAYDELKRKGLRFLTVREFDAGLQLIFVTGEDRIPDRALEAMSRIEGVISIYVCVNTSKKQDFEAGKYEKKFGKATIEQYFMQKTFTISPKDDFPVYRQHAVRVAKEIADMIPEDTLSILEVNSGIGLYSLGLDERYVIKGIDERKGDIVDAMNNVRLMGRMNVNYESGKMDTLFPTLCKARHFDLVMVHVREAKYDPHFISNLRLSTTRHILLFGDHLSTMAKMAGELKENYRLAKIVNLDGAPNGSTLTTIMRLDLA